MSSRNLQMLRWSEGHRRSPRISALDSCKAQKKRQDMVGLEGPASASRTSGGRRKRKLPAVEDTEDESDDQPSQEDHSSDSEQPEESSKHQQNDPGTGHQSTVPFETELPKKHVLELVLDTLQRRDTYEIFAEPVDPNEVEDYYEIIEEPMDFGTMRAKLHEGMYENLQQFEHDAFLITKNAMHFNSSTTIYFRQARAIHELAKKVFRLLKTDPEEFELQFSGTRRRSTRKLTKPENYRAPFSNKSFRKTSSNMGLEGAIAHEPSNTAHCFTGVPSQSRSVQIGSTLRESSNGRRQTDRRSMYRPWRSLLTDSSLIFSATSSDLQPLMLVNQQDIGYAESLMLFSKNLGPTAQKVAQKKLLGLGKSSDIPNLCISTSQSCSLAPKSGAGDVLTSTIWSGSQDKTATMQVTSKSKNLWDCPNRRPVVLGCTSPRLYSSLMDARKRAASMDQRSNLPHDFGHVTLNISQKSNLVQSPVIHAAENAKVQSDSYSCTPENQMWTSETTSNICRTDSLDARKEESVLNLSKIWLQKNTGYLQHASLVKSQSDPSPSNLRPPTSQFKFGLPYLKMKLEQMRSVEQERLAYNPGSSIPGDLLTNENIYQCYIDHGETYTGFGGYTSKQQGSLDDGCFNDLVFQM